MISVPLTWPRGSYALPETTDGCPMKFTSGCRYQDNEDTNNQNQFSQGIQYLEGQFDDSRDNIQICYCVRINDDTTSLFTWPPGQYCIAKKGVCPDGFQVGSIFWDDENYNNMNSKIDTLPDGTFNTNTKVDYCCRADGDPNDMIYLPNTQAFAMYPNEDSTCQSVFKMTSLLLYIESDDEDSGNQNLCTGDYPYINNNCNHNDHRVYICYYRPVYV